MPTRSKDTGRPSASRHDTTIENTCSRHAGAIPKNPGACGRESLSGAPPEAPVEDGYELVLWTSSQWALSKTGINDWLMTALLVLFGYAAWAEINS